MRAVLQTGNPAKEDIAPGAETVASLAMPRRVTGTVPRSAAKAGGIRDMLKTYAYLMLAIVCEVMATTALARSESFTRLVPSIIAIAGYAAAFWLLSFAMRVIPAGVVYAIWSGMGIVLITAIAWIWYRETLDTPALIGLGLIVLGVLVINLFSRSVGH